jgi:hypothetical protein
MGPRRSSDLRAAASTLVQYGLAYAVGIPVFVLYTIARRIRRRREPSVLPPQP